MTDKCQFSHGLAELRKLDDVKIIINPIALTTTSSKFNAAK
jgi:hypothetical protein